MKTKLIYAVVVLCTIACQKKEEKSSEELTPVTETVMVEIDSIPMKKGEYLITEEVFWVMQEEPENHFDKANKSFVSKELKDAAVEIRKASIYVGFEMSKASSKEKQLLSRSKNELDSLATRLEAGENIKEAELREAFYKTNLALYENFRNQYEHLQSDNKQISSYLDAAVQKVENTYKWSGEGFKADARKVIDEGKLLSNRLKMDLKENKKTADKEWALFKEKLKSFDAKLEGNANN